MQEYPQQSKWLRLCLLLGFALALLAAFYFRDRFDAAAIDSWLRNAGAAGPIVFIACYALAAVLFLPGAIMTVAGGAVFGPVLGTLYNLTGATLGAALAFITARYLGGDWVARRSGARLRGLIEGVEAEGWRFIAFVRLVPLFPFNLSNYALGLTRIPLLTYVVTSFIAMAPGAFAYTYLGYAGREVITGGEGTIGKALLAVGLIAALVFVPGLVKRTRGRKG